MNKKEMKDMVCRKVDALQPLIYNIAMTLHDHPELSGEEVQSAAFLRKVLQDHGFA